MGGGGSRTGIETAGHQDADFLAVRTGRITSPPSSRPLKTRRGGTIPPLVPCREAPGPSRLGRYTAVQVSREVFEGIEAVRRSGLTNMLDRPAVVRLAAEMGYDACARWVRENRALYARGVFHGFAVAEGHACPCGCEGRAANHDERAWGLWPCPACGDDSDADYGLPCSSCAGGGR